MSGRVAFSSPGGWVAITSEDGWLLAEIDPTDLTSLVTWGLLRNHAALDAVLDALLAKGLRAVRNFVLARCNDDDSASVVVRGAGSVLVEREGAEPERISGHDLATWRETSVPAGWVSLQLTAGEQASEQHGMGDSAAPLSPGITLAGVIRVVDQSRATPAADRDRAPGAPPDIAARRDELDLDLNELELNDLDFDDLGHDGYGLEQPMIPVEAADPHPQTAPPIPTQAVSISELFDDEAEQQPAADQPAEHEPAEPAEHEPAEPAVTADQGEDADGERNDGPDEQTDPYSAPAAQAPLVDTVRCDEGHLNPLTVGFCRVCGTQLKAQVPSRQPRPRLGVLRMSTGEVIPLDGDVVFGRSPSAQAAGVPNDARLITLDSPNQDASRTHCAIHLDGWVALIADLNSTNGTTLTGPAGRSDRLPPNQPVVLEPGSTVNIAGEVSFRYDPAG